MNRINYLNDPIDPVKSSDVINPFKFAKNNFLAKTPE